MEISSTISSICCIYGVIPTNVAKSRFRHLKEYTYLEILDRILRSQDKPITEVFTELAPTTIRDMLYTVFPGKDTSRTTWNTYLLSLVNLFTCYKCNQLKPFKSFTLETRSLYGISKICKECSKEIRDTTKDSRVVYQKQYRIDNCAKLKEYMYNYYSNNTAYWRAKGIEYKDRKRVALPTWANLEKMNDIYKRCPKGYHVDHIIPLKGALVSGLHVENNLQYLKAADNLSKHNTFLVE
jgi:hypothetical protein